MPVIPGRIVTASGPTASRNAPTNLICAEFARALRTISSLRSSPLCVLSRQITSPGAGPSVLAHCLAPWYKPDMEKKRVVEQDPKLNPDDLVVIAGAGGFIASKPGLVLQEQGVQADSGRGQKAPLRVVFAGARSREPEPGLQRRGPLPPRLRRGRRGL